MALLKNANKAKKQLNRKARAHENTLDLPAFQPKQLGLLIFGRTSPYNLRLKYKKSPEIIGDSV